MTSPCLIPVRSVVSAVVCVAIAVALTDLARPASASGRYRTQVGLGDQSASMFSQPAFTALHLRQTRYVIAWNAADDPQQMQRARTWVAAARAAGLRPLLHIGTDTFEPGRARLPSVAVYRRHVRALAAAFAAAGVRDWGTWNEANHRTQPTYRSARRAAQYFLVMRAELARRCDGCKVVALDVLDQAGASRYISTFMRTLGRHRARRYVRVVGIHNYAGVQRRSATGLKAMMAQIRRGAPRAKIWLTETGGIVSFADAWPCDEQRAADRLDYLLGLTGRMHRRIGRVYLYNWTGTDCRSRFDSGLVRADGTPRPGYYVLQRWLREFRR